VFRPLLHPSTRLVQEPHNTISLPLYASLGFDVKEPLSKPL